MHMIQEHRSDTGGRRASQGVDLTVPARTVSTETVYRGAIFSVDDRIIALRGKDGHETRIRRQVVTHAPSVVMLVHDVSRDRYILEREYRVGSNSFAYGLPAGLMEQGENARFSALRELREETGVVPDTPEDLRIESIADCYPSDGMSNEFVHIMALRLQHWHRAALDFDPDEYVESAWLDWDGLRHADIRGANATIAVQYEELRRLRLSLA